MSNPSIDLNIEGNVAVLTMNNPPANTWTQDTLTALKDTVTELNANKNVYALVITGQGEKFFSAGADLNVFASGDKGVAATMSKVFGDAFEALTNFRGVSIAAINGYAMGGGLEVALACDIRIAEDRGVLVIIVQERPSISEIVLDGNKALKSEALLEGLSNSGLAEGKVFKRSTLEGMRMELTRQYVSQGRYDASIETDVIALPRNRVSVNINIDEGSTAAIKHINVVGNRVYSDKKLSEIFELQSTGWLSWMNNKDK
uniref:enoyl-CoA hydratase-related protein n=1 Tax=uncultured Pseudoalteromonas sp. TaxID=114053 RepID=UPI00261096BC